MSNVDEGTLTQEATPEVVEEVEQVPEFTLDNLLELNEQDDPLFSDEANYKGIRPISEYLHHLPEDLRKNLANLRSMATRKTMELAQLKAELAQERAQLAQERDMIANSPVFKKMQEVSGDEPVDMWTEEGLRKAAQVEAAKLLQETFAPLREKLELEQAEARANAFVQANPDAKTDVELRNMIVEQLKAREDLTLEDAYFICKGKLNSARGAAASREAAATRTQHKDALKKTSTGAAQGGTSKPTFKSAEESMMYHMSRQGLVK